MRPLGALAHVGSRSHEGDPAGAHDWKLSQMQGLAKGVARISVGDQNNCSPRPPSITKPATHAPAQSRRFVVRKELQ